MTVEDILKEYGAYYDLNNKGALAAQKKALEDAAQRNKNTLNTSAQKSIDSIVSLGKEQEREADISAQEALETNNIRKLINEKKVAEAMANQGLTDSGLNRTQQTALQVSHGNAAAQIELQRQKNVDSVAKWIRDNVASVVTERDAKVADIENTLQGNLAQADADYAAGKTQYVQDAYTNTLTQQSETQKAGTASNTVRDSFLQNWDAEPMSESNVAALKRNMENYPYTDAWKRPAQEYIMSLLNNPEATEEELGKMIELYDSLYGGDLADTFLLDIYTNNDNLSRFDFDKTTGNITLKNDRQHGRFNKDGAYIYTDENNKEHRILGVGMDALNEQGFAEGRDLDESADKNAIKTLKKAFQDNGIEEYMLLREKYANENGISKLSMDEQMYKMFGALFLIAAATNENYSYLRDSAVKVTDKGDNANLFGIDRDVWLHVIGTEDQQLKEWRKNADRKGIKRSVINEILKNYSADKVKEDNEDV